MHSQAISSGRPEINLSVSYEIWYFPLELPEGSSFVSVPLSFSINLLRFSASFFHFRELLFIFFHSPNIFLIFPSSSPNTHTPPNFLHFPSIIFPTFFCFPLLFFFSFFHIIFFFLLSISSVSVLVRFLFFFIFFFLFFFIYLFFVHVPTE